MKVLIENYDIETEEYIPLFCQVLDINLDKLKAIIRDIPTSYRKVKSRIRVITRDYIFYKFSHKILCYEINRINGGFWEMDMYKFDIFFEDIEEEIVNLRDFLDINRDVYIIKNEMRIIQELQKILGLEKIKSPEKLSENGFSFSIDFNRITTMKITNCNLKFLPDSLCDLKFLSKLNLENNSLKEIPRCINDLTFLTRLSLYENKISDLPESIQELDYLNMLSLGENAFKLFPEVICNITSLRVLYLYKNQLIKIPEKIGDLTNLDTLILEDNQIEDLPKSMNSLTKLNFLDLSNNSLKEIPKFITDLKSLISLKIRGFKNQEDLFEQIGDFRLRNRETGLYQKPRDEVQPIKEDTILDALTNEWCSISDLIDKFRIIDLMDTRFLQIKLKGLELKGLISVEMINEKKHWKKI
jgi:hypothetical protein